MTKDQELFTVKVVRLSAAESGGLDTISVAADIPGGGAATTVVPTSSFAQGYSIWIDESARHSGFSAGGRVSAYTVNVKVTDTFATNILELHAPSRELALAVQHELSKQVQAALRGAHTQTQPSRASSFAAAMPVHSIVRPSWRKRVIVSGAAVVGIAVVAVVLGLGHRGTRSEPLDPINPVLQADPSQAASFASPTGPQPLAQLIPIAPPTGPEKDMDVTGNQLNDVDMGNLKTMGAKVGIQLRAGEVPFYVLADPACAACRALEPIWTQVPAHYKPIIIPVGFQTGGEALAIGIQCSKDRVAAWKKTLAGDESLAVKRSDCKDGATKVTAGNLFFHYLRLTGTPTIIAPNGVIASGGDTVETLTAFLKQNEAAK
ncbi:MULTISPECIES: hypothetical protein [unclassified Cupriavidus]|uniref:hypothetical protein n=1 Tax=unclassified Cupriavidus TaxID=2640874 RepID=UPI00313AF300